MNLYVPPKLSAEALALIKHFEGCFLEAYCDPVGVWTIGYGHTSRVRKGQSLRPRQAEDLLMEDLDIAQADVRHNVKVPLNDNEFGAMVSLAFNIGGTALAHSTLVRKLNAGDRTAAGHEFEKFVYGHIRGRRVKLRGLEIRRKAERAMFEAPVGTLVENGYMVLAERRIPVEHPSIDVAHVGPPPPPQHFYYPPYPWFPPSGQMPSDSAAAEPSARVTVDTQVPRAKAPVARGTLAALAVGAAAGAIPASNAPAAQNLVGVIGDVWQKAGGPALFPAQTSWLRWIEAFNTGASQLFRTGDFGPLLAYLAGFIRSHEALVAFIFTVVMLLLRSAAGGILADRRRDA